MDKYLDAIENYFRNRVFPKILDILHIIYIYSCIILDKYGMFQKTHSVNNDSCVPDDFLLSYDNFCENSEEFMIKTDTNELNYGKMITNNIRLNISEDTINKVAIVSEMINPQYVINLATNTPNVKYDIYTSNPDIWKPIENINIYDKNDISNTNEFYDRIYVGLHVCHGKYKEYYSTLKKKLNHNSKLIIQCIISIDYIYTKPINIRNTLTFRDFFNLKNSHSGDFIIPSIKELIKFYTLIDLFPLKCLENDVKLIKNNVGKGTSMYSLLEKTITIMKLMGNTYYVACFEY